MTATDPSDDTGIGAAQTTPVARSRRSTPPASEADELPAVPDLGEPGVEVFASSNTARTALRPYLRSLWQRRAFMVELARSQIRGQHSNTLLGSLWTVLDPLFMAGLYFFLFSVIRGGDGRPVDFLPVLVGGMFLFTLTTTALNDGGKAVTRSARLMLNSAFPRAVLPLSQVYKSLVAFVPTVVVYVVIYAIWGSGLQIGLLALPGLLAVQITMNVGIALLMSTMVVFFRDTENALRYIQRFLFFTTPVIWPYTLLSDELQDLLAYHPLYPLFTSYQMVLGGGTADAELVVRAVVWALLLLVVGAWAFLRNERAMASRVV